MIKELLRQSFIWSSKSESFDAEKWVLTRVTFESRTPSRLVEWLQRTRHVKSSSLETQRTSHNGAVIRHYNSKQNYKGGKLKTETAPGAVKLDGYFKRVPSQISCNCIRFVFTSTTTTSRLLTRPRKLTLISAVRD